MTDQNDDVSERGENPVYRWFMVDGNRWVIVIGISVAIYLVLVGLGTIGFIGVQQSSLVTGIFTASITGVFTLVSITITINQLVLSRIVGSPGQIQDRIDSVRNFRISVQEMVDPVPVSPTEPAAFLELVTHALSDRVNRFEAVYGDDHTPEQRHQVERLIDSLRTLISGTNSDIDGADDSLFTVLSAVLNNKFSQHLNTVRRIRANSEGLTPEEDDALEELDEILEEINRTRHYFKTLYLHSELASLSRVLLLSGVPALVASFVTVLLYDGFASTASETVLLLVVSGTMTIVLAPLVILLSFSLRFITIAKRTTTFGTFTPPEELP